MSTGRYSTLLCRSRSTEYQSLDEKLPVETPPASGSGVIRAPDFNIQQRTGPKLLRAVAKKRNIVSTESLVAAYNATTVANERTVLRNWLIKYGEAKEDCLKPKAVLEYSELAKVVLVSEQDARVPRNLVYDLGSLIHPDEFLDENVAKALLSALTWADATVYDDLAQLFVLTKRLLLSLSSELRLTKHNFAKHEASFLAISQVFFLLQSIGRGYALEEEKKELRQVVAQKRDLMKLSVLYYPVFFYFELIQQAIERLETEDAPSRLTTAVRYTASGFYGSIHLFHILSTLAGGDIDPTSVEDAYEKGRAAIAKAGVLEREWYDILQILTSARILSLKDEGKLEVFSIALDAAMIGQSKTTGENEQKALRFGIVQEMRLLASDKDSSYDCRKKATTKLVELATDQAISENWIHDADVLTTILVALHAIFHVTGEQNQEIADAIQTIQQSCDERAKETLTIWLDGNTIEEKLQMQRKECADDEHGDLFAKTGAGVGYLHPSTIRSNMEDLKNTYLHHRFATVSAFWCHFNQPRIVPCSKAPSLFEREDPKHVKDMEHHVVAYEESVKKWAIDRREEEREEREYDEMEVESSTMEVESSTMEVESSTIEKKDDPKEYCEQKRKVATPVSIEDFFEPRSLKAGVGKSEIRRVLLYGNPGSGKTCLSKAIAHKWALGHMLQGFKSIYVVPIRRLNVAKAEGVRGDALGEVIASMCFKQKRNDAEFEELKTQVTDDLDMSSTLLVLDGLDEADDDAADLLSEVEKSGCKLLMLTRPYNLQGVRSRVDLEFECLGFNDRQLKNYIIKELQQDEALTLIRSLQQDRGMWETAHTPVTTHILCSLSKTHGTFVENRGRWASVFRIYGDMTNYVWERFKERPETRLFNKDLVFGDLEKIAFEALRSGQILIEERIVKSHATSTNTTRIFKESGFLLFVLEGQQYQFPHFTFQEYFAGRFIAKSLKNKGPDEERVLEFLQEEKYSQKNALTLSFAMHAFAQGQSKEVFSKMITIVDQQPVEVLGVQHLFLRMRVLEAILGEIDERKVEDLLNDEHAIKLAESACGLLERTIDDVLVRKIVIKRFRQLSRVLEGFPQIVNGTVDEAQNMLACSRSLGWKEVAKVKDILKLARGLPRQSTRIVQSVLAQFEAPDGSCDARERIRKLILVTGQMPEHVGEVLPVLERECDGNLRSMRESAAKAICHLVAAGPQHAGQVLPTLLNWCNDAESAQVDRLEAMKAICRVIESAPHHVDEVLPTLMDWSADEAREYVVRLAAIEAVGRVIESAPHHVDEVLPTLRIWSDGGDIHVRLAAMEAVGRVVAAAPQHAREVIPDLWAAGSNENKNVRQAAVEALGSVAEAAPRHALGVISTLVNGCGEENSEDMRAAATYALGRVLAKSPQYVYDVLPTLVEGCNHVAPEQVRTSAMDAIGRIVEAAPQHAESFLPALIRACRDEKRRVREAAIDATGRVVAAAPHHAEAVLPTLIGAYRGIYSYVSRAVMEAIGRIVAAAPQHVDDALQTLVKGCDDFSEKARRAAIDAVGRVVATAPQHADKVLPKLKNGCEDGGSEAVRQAAMEAIGRVVANLPKLVVDVLPALAKGCSDEYRNVRVSAKMALRRIKFEKALTCSGPSFFFSYKGLYLFLFVDNTFTLSTSSALPTVSFVMHTSSSREIGSWAKVVVDWFIHGLRQEFDDKFPGLREHVT